VSSPNVFAKAWGTPIHIGLGVVFAFGFGALALWLVVRLAGGRRWAAIPGLLVVAAAGVGGLLLGVLFPWPAGYLGRYQELYLTSAGGREAVSILIRDSAGKQATEYRHILTFDLDSGRELGRTSLPTEDATETPERFGGSRGTLAWFSTPRGYVIVDLLAGRTVARQRDRVRGLGRYRTEGFDPDRWAIELLLADGRTTWVDMAPPAPGEGRVTRLAAGDAGCTSWARRADDGTSVAGMLRAVPVGDCRLGGVRLYLHRSTAFGGGHYLLGAVGDDGARRWSLDLSERYDDDLRYEVLIARQRPDGLRLLVGAVDTTYWIWIDPATGRVRDQRALY